MNGDNLGYCRGNNVGIRYALAQGADYVFLLNSDTKMTPTLIGELVRVMQSDPTHRHRRRQEPLMQNPAYTWGKYGIVNWGPMLVPHASAASCPTTSATIRRRTSTG